MTFDLTTEPWVPVTVGGRYREISLLELFDNPSSISDLAPSSPHERAALTRILAVIIQAAIQEPITADIKRGWLRDPSAPAAAVRDYLVAHRGEFDLFDLTQPFMQQPIAEQMAREDTVAALGIEMSSGNNITLFDHHIDAEPPAIPPAMAVRMLLVSLLYQPGGGVSKPFNRTDSPGTKFVMAVPVGSDLWQTLVLSCPSLGAEQLRTRPAWERDPADDRPDKEGRVPDGWLDLGTWRSRAVQMYPDDDGMVRRIRMHQHLKVSVVPEGDPFVPLNRDGEPMRLRPGTRTWAQADVVYHGIVGHRGHVVREAARLLDEFGMQLRVSVSGLEVKQAKIVDARGASLPVSNALLEDRLDLVTDAIKDAMDGSRLIFKVAATYSEGGASSADEGFGFGEAKELASRLQQVYWSSLEGPFHAFVADVAGAREAPSPSGTEYAHWRTGTRDGIRLAFAAVDRLGGGAPRSMKARALAKGRMTWELNRTLPNIRTEDVDGSRA